MQTDSPKAVVFDVGNTLWFQARSPDTAEIQRLQGEPLRPLFASWGITLPCSMSEFVADVVAAGDEFERVQGERRTLREVDIPFLMRGALAVRGIEITPEQAGEMWRASWILERHFGVQLCPDTLDVLRALRRSGVLVGINTNRPCTSDMHLPGLRDMGIAPYVDAVVCSGDTGYTKPHRSTFDLILSKLAVAPHEAVMVGDLAVADMRGARAVGMRTVWKLNGRYDLSPCPDADHQIHNLSELLALPLLSDPVRVVGAESLTPHDDNNADRY
jgi:HAD superfamily hydrolase (TIGR01549 family)